MDTNTYLPAWFRRLCSRTAAVARRAAGPLVTITVVVLAAVATIGCVGSAVGRYQLTRADAEGRGVNLSHDALLVVVPVPTLKLREGDVVMLRRDHDARPVPYRITGIDSWTHEVYAPDRSGKLVALKIGDTAGRLSYSVPWLGTPFGWIIGTPQALVLLFLAMLLLVKAALQLRSSRPELGPLQRRVLDRLHRLVSSPARQRAVLMTQLRAELARLEGTRRRAFRMSRWWWTRFGALLVWVLGVFSLTASANFTATGSVAMSSTATGHMSMTIAGAGSTNRLTLGATGLVPGDRMQRALDLTIDNTTTTGIMTGLTLTVSANPSSSLNTDATNGLRIFIQDCQTNSNGTGWTESGSSPAFTYSCTKGAGGSQNDLLYSAGADPSATTLPSAGTCAQSNGGTGGYRALSELSGGFTMVNLPLSSGALVPNTTIHMVVTMCLPAADTDSMQDQASTLTFSFAGVQRSPTNK